MATSADAVANVLAGNIFLKPNIEASFCLLSQSDNNFSYQPQTMTVEIDILPLNEYDANNPPVYKMIFKNGNFIELTLTETFAGALLSELSLPDP